MAKSDDYETPKEIYDELDAEFKFDFDPCPSNPAFDGLSIQWKRSNYVNPPYSNPRPWVAKPIEEARKGKTCVLLLRADPSTNYFHRLIMPNAREVRFRRGRIKFDGKSPAPFASMIVVF